MDLLHVQTIEGNTTKHILSMKCGGDKAIQNLAEMLSANDLYHLLLCTNVQGFTAAHLAAAHNNTEVLKEMLIGLSNKKLMVLLNTKTREGETMMHIVSKKSEFGKVTQKLATMLGVNDLCDLLLCADAQGFTTTTPKF